MSKVVLYTYWRSSSAYRVRIALAAKGIAWESVAVNLLKDEQSNATYVAEKNPMGRVPCLVLDGKPFIESTAIIEMLEELYPDPPLLPKDARDRAHVRALSQIINSGTQPFQNISVLKRAAADDEGRKAWAAHFIEQGLRGFDALMVARGDTGPYAFGTTLGMADCFLVPQIMGAERFGVDLGPMPNVRRAYEQAKKHDAVLAALPETQTDAPKK
jgi:maleylacetoacetate isomerase